MFEVINPWHGVDESRIQENDFLTMIEIPKGSKQKYELDKATGFMILDRILYTSTQYPANYGFIPKTLSGDGDPLDVLVLASEKINSMTFVRCYPIGMVTMIDDGKPDEKIIAIPYNDPTYNFYNSIEELPKHISEEMVHFLRVYKELEDKVTSISSVKGADEARLAIKTAKQNYLNKYGK